MDELFKSDFPKLANVAAKKTSEADTRYNCIAWVFGDNRRWWWPSTRAYWPMDTAGKTVIEAFEEWFDRDGWEPITSLEFEAGFTKIALFAKDGHPTHAARQLKNGLWTSKLGQNIDIVHKHDELDGPKYGAVTRIYRKPA